MTAMNPLTTPQPPSPFTSWSEWLLAIGPIARRLNQEAAQDEGTDDGR